MFHRLLAAAGLSSSDPTPPSWSPATGVVAPPSSSAMVADSVTGSHVLTIKGYSRTKGFGNGKSLSSGTFSIGGHRWCIHYYPDGRGSDNSDWISVCLQLDESTTIDAMARYTFTLLDGDGEPAPSYSRSSARIQRFMWKGDPWGCHRFIKRKELEKSAVYLKDDCVRVRCDVTVYKEIRKEEDDERYVVVPPPDLDWHLGRLLAGGEGADVTFEVAGEKVVAHRCILAVRSPVFMAELFGPMKEKTSACVQIDDMEARVFKALLHFVYTDSLPEIEDDDDKVVMAQHLLVAADRYSLRRLKLMCEDNLCDYIDASNVGTILALAEQHGYRGLKKACFKFLKSGSNLKAAVATDGFEHLTNSCPSVLKELLTKVANLLSSS